MLFLLDAVCHLQFLSYFLHLSLYLFLHSTSTSACRVHGERQIGCPRRKHQRHSRADFRGSTRLTIEIAKRKSHKITLDGRNGEKDITLHRSWTQSHGFRPCTCQTMMSFCGTCHTWCHLWSKLEPFRLLQAIGLSSKYVYTDLKSMVPE